MAKLITFLVFLCIEFSRQEKVSVGVSTDDVLQQILHETYPLEINLDKDEDYLKSTETSSTESKKNEYHKVILDIEKWMKEAHPDMSNYKWLRIVEKEAEINCNSSYDYDDETEEEEDDKLFSHRPQNSWQIGTDVYQIWDDYVQMTLDVEKLMTKARPDMGKYKWLKVLEEGSLAKGTVPECSSSVGSSFDFNDRNKENSQQLNSKDDGGQLMKDFDELVLFIENWMTKINHRMRNYKWLRALEMGAAAMCSDRMTNNYDYHYEFDSATFVDSNDEYKMKISGLSKRFTSV